MSSTPFRMLALIGKRNTRTTRARLAVYLEGAVAKWLNKPCPRARWARRGYEETEAPTALKAFIGMLCSQLDDFAARGWIDTAKGLDLDALGATFGVQRAVPFGSSTPITVGTAGDPPPADWPEPRVTVTVKAGPPRARNDDGHMPRVDAAVTDAIPDEPILLFLQRYAGEDDGQWCTFGEPGQWMPSVQDAMPPGTPSDVQHAKMRALMVRGLVDGCACGCRGDFELSVEGARYLATLGKGM